MNELALFAGAGGGILGGKLLGWRTVCAVERDACAAQVLAQRQNDGILEAFPIWSDVTSFDGKPWRGIVDIVSGGFPCQDISAAGKGAGIEGERSGMWKEFARIIGDVHPRYAFVENSPMLTTRGLGTVLADLAALGFDAEWGVLSAADVGANHQRERIWIVAQRREFLSHAEHNWHRWRQQLRQGTEKEIKSRNTKWQLADTDMLGCDDRQAEINATEAKLNAQREFGASGSDVAHAICDRRHAWRNHDGKHDGAIAEQSTGIGGENVISYTASIRQQGQRESIKWGSKAEDRNRQANIIKSIGERGQWRTEPNVGRVANGVAFRVDRLKAIGNGQVPLCAATAFELLRERLEA